MTGNYTGAFFVAATNFTEHDVNARAHKQIMSATLDSVVLYSKAITVIAPKSLPEIKGSYHERQRRVLARLITIF